MKVGRKYSLLLSTGILIVDLRICETRLLLGETRQNLGCGSLSQKYQAALKVSSRASSRKI